MRYLILISLLFTTSCGYFDRMLATYTGSSEMCIKGIKYIQFTSGASVKIDPSTLKPQTCDEKTGKDTSIYENN
jgi:hypothetical protein